MHVKGDERFQPRPQKALHNRHGEVEGRREKKQEGETCGYRLVANDDKGRANVRGVS